MQPSADAPNSSPKRSRSGTFIIVAIASVVLVLFIGGIGILYVIGVHANKSEEDHEMDHFEPSAQLPGDSNSEMPQARPVPAVERTGGFAVMSDTLYTEKILGTWRVRRMLEGGVVLDMQGLYSGDSRAIWSGTVTYTSGQSYFVTINGTWQVKEGNFYFRVDSSNIPQFIPNGYTSTSKIVTLTDEQWTYVDAIDGGSETAFRVK
jgi:hypothetical protein